MKQLAALGVLALTLAFAYGPVATRLVHDWATDGNYSHGFLIAPVALYLGWERRVSLARAQGRPTVTGLVVLLASLAALIAGVLGAELFLTRVSMIGVAAGIVLFVWGREHLRILTFPMALLLLMIPLPAIVFNRIAFALQLVASTGGELALRLAGVPVLREGNVITLANASLEVAEACSGIRSLVSLVTLGILYGYWADRRPAMRIVLAIATLPIAILTNALRVAGTGLAAHYFGPAAADGFFHVFSGWTVFVAALVLLLAVHRAVKLATFAASAPHVAVEA